MNKINKIVSNFVIINITGGIAIGMVNFIIPIYALSINATQTEIGFIRGITGIGDLAIVLPAGFLADYLGSKKSYSIGCILGAVSIILIPLAKTPVTLLYIMLLYGMTRTLRATSLSAEFFRNINIIGNKKGGWYRGSLTMGTAFFGPLLGGIGAIYLGFDQFFILSTIILMVPLVLVIKNFSNTQTQKNFSIIQASNNYKELMKNKILVRSTVIESINIAFFMTFATFITVFVIKDLNLSSGMAALLQSLKGGSTILIVLLGGTLLREKNDKLYLIAFAITIFSLLLLAIGKDITQLSIASIILGIGSGLVSLITFTDVSNIKGEKGKIAGIYSLGFGLGNIYGPTIAGMIGDAFGTRAIFLAFIPVFILSGLYILKVRDSVN